LEIKIQELFEVVRKFRIDWWIYEECVEVEKGEKIKNSASFRK
jgi:hypothetical protein